MMTMDRPIETDDDTWGIQQVADYLGVSRQTVYRMIDRGDLAPLPKKPYLRRAQKLAFRRADVERLARGEPPEPAEG